MYIWEPQKYLFTLSSASLKLLDSKAPKVKTSVHYLIFYSISTDHRGPFST